MNDPEFHKAYEEQNARDYIANARFGSLVSIPLDLSCSVMDYFMYPDQVWNFFKLRVLCGLLTALVWFGFTKGWCHRRLFGVTWFMGPLMMIFWMIFSLPDQLSPYYAGLNIILLAMGLISPWTARQNLAITVFVLVMYVVVALTKATPQPLNYILNNTTFIFLTAAFVVLGSRSNARQRLHEFSLRWELDRSRKVVEESNQKLIEMDQVKGRFFANISHELRTPLTLIISPLETILARYSATLGADTVGLLRTMQSNGLRLLKLINDLLDLVRLDSGVMEARREPVALDEFLRGMASAARQVAEDKRIELVVSVAPDLGHAMLDRDKMEKIVLNLQFNALKFTPAGGRVELRARREGDELILQVSDTGIGIPKKDLPNVFGRFFQVDSSARRKYQGVGIGLALVKELTELHGGTVAVDSVEGQGTTFTSRMPYLQPDAAALAAARTPTPGAAPGTGAPAVVEESGPVTTGGTVSSSEWLADLYHRAAFFTGPIGDKTARNGSASTEAEAPNDGKTLTVLVADDQPDMLGFLKSELTRHYRVIEATDGQQAVDKAAQFTPDIILLDLMMPEKDGMQAAREIRAAPATRNVPIVLVTAHVDEETKLNALRAGCSDFLPKPFSTTELHVRVKNLVDSHSFQRQLADQNQQLSTTIQQLKETETMLVHTEKLASLGRMSAGLIHEINNPLNYATTGLFTLRNKARHLAAEQQEDYAEILKDVEEGIGRVKTIVSDLRSFTHPDTASLEEVNVSEAVTAALRFLSHGWRENTSIEVDLPEGLTVWANKNTLTQVVLNLLQNSLDALQKKEFNGERPVIRITGRQEEGRSQIFVRDNGTGIASEVVDKIFDPFFTTKDVGEGMGLGLSICYRIIQASGGTITVRSEPGQLCEFTLDFPVPTAKQF